METGINIPLPESYPDLNPSLELLNQRLANNPSEEQEQVLRKWQAQLTQIQTEINHLKKLDAFSASLNQKRA